MVTTAKENGLPHINEHTRTERAVYAAGFLFNIILGVFALAPALASFFTHMQKGFEGAGLIIPGVSHLGIWGKRAVGFMPGVAPAMLYANSTLDIPGLLLLMAAASFKSPLRSLPLAMLVLVANYFAAGSMQTVSEHIASDKENIIGFNETTNSALCVAYILFTTLGGAFANLKPSIQLAFSKTVTLEKITLNQYMEHLGHNSNKISDGTREKLRSLSIFKPVVIPSGQDNDPVPTGPVYV